MGNFFEILGATVALVIGGTMAFATFFVAESTKKERLKGKKLE